MDRCPARRAERVINRNNNNMFGMGCIRGCMGLTGVQFTVLDLQNYSLQINPSSKEFHSSMFFAAVIQSPPAKLDSSSAHLNFGLP